MLVAAAWVQVRVGPTWKVGIDLRNCGSRVLNINGQFSSFLRAGDGAIYAGTMDGKLYVRPGSATDATAFTSHDAPHLRCLGQRPGTTRIYACADMTLDGFSLGSSDDNGATFQPVMSFTQLLGPLTCPPVQTNCQAHWERIQGVLGIGPGTGPPDAGGGRSSSGSGGSHCASANIDAWSIWIVLAFLARRVSSSSRARSRRAATSSGIA